ncbi:MAG: hypothetical protein Q7S06_02010 [Nanoarchaeota archaeon]|nr:hypothetical protein [Nanoarchaeota archaeon]
MRKIVSRETEAKKRKRNQLIIGGILVGIMILSTVGYAVNRESPSGAKKITYKGIEFVQQNGYWFATIGGVQFAFKYNPQETEEINGFATIRINDYSGKPLYISSDNLDAENELYQNLDSIILRRQSACLQGQTCSNKDYPVKTCDDNFIIIKEAGNTSISQEKNCVFIEGKKEDSVKLIDKFLYKTLGIQ